MGEELDGFDASGDFLIKLSLGSRIEKSCDLATVEWASQLPFG